MATSEGLAEQPDVVRPAHDRQGAKAGAGMQDQPARLGIMQVDRAVPGRRHERHGMRDGALKRRVDAALERQARR